MNVRLITVTILITIALIAIVGLPYYTAHVIHPHQQNHHYSSKTEKLNAAALKQKGVHHPTTMTVLAGNDDHDHDHDHDNVDDHSFPKLFEFIEPDPNDGTLPVQDEKGGPEHRITCKIVSKARPRVLTCENFVSAEEAEHLIELGEPKLVASGIAVEGPHRRNVRSSYGTRLPSSDPVVKKVDRRILSMLRHFSGLHAERLYLLRYNRGEKYSQHTDGFGGIAGSAYVTARRKRYKAWLDKLARRKANNKKYRRHNNKQSKNEEEEQPTTPTSTTLDGKYARIDDNKNYTFLDRAVTTLVYLRTMPEGGGGNTSFPLLDPHGRRLSKAEIAAELRALRHHQQHQHQHQHEGGNSKKEWTGRGNATTPVVVEAACDPTKHLTVAPVQGRILIFYDMLETGEFDAYSSHAGCAVLGDTPKWTMTKWIQIPLP